MCTTKRVLFHSSHYDKNNTVQLSMYKHQNLKKQKRKNGLLWTHLEAHSTPDTRPLFSCMNVKYSGDATILLYMNVKNSYDTQKPSINCKNSKICIIEY